MGTIIKELLTKQAENVPNFVARASYTDEGDLPMRIYFHRFGLEDAFGKVGGALYEDAFKYALEVVRARKSLLEGRSHVIAAAWGNNNHKMLDVFAYAKTGSWPGNPEVGMFAFRNGLYLVEQRDLTCGDGSIVIGQEEEHRRAMKDLRTWVMTPPSLRGLISSGNW